MCTVTLSFGLGFCQIGTEEGQENRGINSIGKSKQIEDSGEGQEVIKVIMS